MATAVKKDPKLAKIRAQLPATAGNGYFNAGTNGPISKASQEALIAASEAEFNRGRIGPGLYEGLGEDWKRVRELFAQLCKCDPSEIGLMRSTGEGMNVALAGVDWQRGDEIITTQLEHPCLFSPMALLNNRHGVVTRVVDIGHGGGDVLGTIEAAITPKTRMIAISHVQWSSGAVMPLKAISAMARKRGILTVIDAAQGVGQVDLDLPDLGVDAYAMAGQKWLCGPGGTGALYIRKDRMPDFKPTYLRYGGFDPSGFVMPPAGAARFEMGELYNPAIRAQEAGLKFLRDEVGQDWAFKRIATLGKRCHAGLSKIKGVTVTTPVTKMAGLVCFQVDGMHPKDVNDAVYEKGYTIRFVDYRPGPAVARVSTGWWNTEEEVDGLVRAVAEVVKENAAAAKAKPKA